jgi:uncharacterized PurR-regulated membrane protein YhhQ (DUF165 family)
LFCEKARIALQRWTRCTEHLDRGETMLLIAVYLAAIVLANLAVALIGPSSTTVVAFLFIGLDLTIRDKLHEQWTHNLKRNMTLLILSGAVLSFLLNHNAFRVALASFVAFALSEATKAVGYHMLRDKSHMTRVNLANVAASFVDSVLFPTIAFGVILPWAITGQFIAKVFGGYIWTLLINRRQAVVSKEA